MSLSHDGNGSHFTFKGWHMALIMLAFFGTIIAVNITMAVIAKKSWTGLVVANSFVASQEYNDVIAKARAQADLGWSSDFAYEYGIISVALTDTEKTAITAETVAVQIGRPAFEQSDRTLYLEPDGTGRYTAHDRLEPGDWAITILARVHDEPYRRDLRLYVGPDGKASMR